MAVTADFTMNCAFFRSVHSTGLWNSMFPFLFFLSNLVAVNLFHSKKSKIQSKSLAPSILEGLMPITTEVEPGDVDDDTPSRVCFLSLLVIFTQSSHIHSSPLSELLTL